jgi:hypothetical protein
MDKLVTEEGFINLVVTVISGCGCIPLYFSQWTSQFQSTIKASMQNEAM